ncbi:MAG: class I SAM-dependent methyltransferase [Acidobacteria bacterium]|nr:class I SAM-dependent methyltransferase [Acidobacteriota bacterium]
MSNAERTKWDERYRAGDHASETPDPLLQRLLDNSLPQPQGRAALDVACGAGRHAVWLAEHGWDAYGCDVSLEGLRVAAQLARTRGVTLKLFCADMDASSLPPNRFDLIVVFFYLQRSLFEVFKSALRPGGFIIFRTYVADATAPEGAGDNPAHVLQPGELAAAFAGFRVLHENKKVGSRAITEFIAQKL